METNFYLHGLFTGFLLGTTICLLAYANLSIKQEEEINRQANFLRDKMFRKDEDEWDN